MDIAYNVFVWEFPSHFLGDLSAKLTSKFAFGFGFW